MIGVFDSGHGGLTILRALTQHLPHRSFLYYGDHAHMPYGERSSAEIVDLTRGAMEYMFQRGCKLTVMACNTAAAVALRTLQQTWLASDYPDHRILGVLVPTVEAVTGVSWLADVAPVSPDKPRRTIAIFATRRTVASNAYVEEIGKRAPEIDVVQQACPDLVNLIEAPAPREDVRAAIKGFVAEMMEKLKGRRPEAVMLGCTHYPIVADLFAEALPADWEILSQPQLVARSMGDYLGRHPEIDTLDSVPQLEFLTTGDAVSASGFATTFFGKPATFQTL
ncbi:MAG: glutamate racemase [Rhodospirillaceae bacterium]|nr:glutamate racemase [Rhodospirillaceae bacterium]